MAKSGRYSADRKKVESLTANKTVTVADCGTLFMLNNASGLTSIVLPSAAQAGNGWWCHFIVATDPVGNDYVIDAANAGEIVGQGFFGLVNTDGGTDADSSTGTNKITFDGSAGGGGGYSEASTPFIISQTGSAATDVTELFKFETLSHGKSSNTEVKIAFANIIGAISGLPQGPYTVKNLKPVQGILYK